MPYKYQKEVEILKSGGVGIIPTDTVYGVAASVFFPEAVERIYEIKKRDRQKPFIFLISSLSDLELFSVAVDSPLQKWLKKLWPGEVSILLPCSPDKLSYLHRANPKMAFRLPQDKNLLEFLTHSGPLASTSANREGEKPAENIEEAKNYFGHKVDFYIDGGNLPPVPSTLVDIDQDQLKIIRQGKVLIDGK